MEEEKAAGGDGDGAGGGQARVSSSFVAVGGRESFAVELRPGETTIVSWKKLVKDASKVKRPSLAAPEPPPSIAPVALEPSIPPEQLVENEVKDEPPASRFSAVIEKIERLYMGKHSSDEEDLNDIPDDDEYDTEDSFIDDAELDEYFQVDDSAIKHDGFFVNRGKLERINKPTLSPHQQPKKRRRKDLVKGHGENDDGHTPNKHVKVGKKAAGNVVPLVGKSSDSPLHTVNVKTKHCEDVKFQNQMNASEVCSKMTYTDNQTSVDPSPSKVSNGDGSLSVADEKDIEKRKTGVALSKSHPNKLKDGSAFSDPSHQRSHDKSSYGQLKSQSGKLLNSVDVVEHSVQRREKSGSRDRPEISVSEGKYSNQNAKIPPMQRKEGSSVRPKSTMLEKAIRELEKMVAESRPPAMEVQDADISSQTVKRRLPHEVKQKLAKVARLAQASHGKISIELINRLMSILGHLIQLRTLKRNLKDMVRMGLSAKQEKDDKFQQIKMEVSDMIKTLVASPNYKALDHPAGISDDFQEIGNEEKDVVKRKCGIDDALEEKICDLYDLYVEGLEEDAGPLVRKLYAELAELWPSGFMDNHGIKRAICRAKDRRRALYIRHKDQEKIKRKNSVATRTDEIVRVEASSIAQPQHIQEKIYTDSVNHNMSSSVSNTTVNTAGRMPGTQMNSSSLDRPKQEKVKGHSSNSISSTRTVDGLAKKKVKRKPELELGESQIRPEKVVSGPGEERHKSQKQVSAPLPSFEKLS